MEVVPVLPVRVLIVDDQRPFLEAAARVVAATEPFVVLGTVGSAEACLTAVPELAPDLVLMDVDLPGMDGVEAARRLALLSDPPAVVLVSSYDEETLAEVTAGTGLVYVTKSTFGSDRLVASWSLASGISTRSTDASSSGSTRT